MLQKITLLALLLLTATALAENKSPWTPATLPDGPKLPLKAISFLDDKTGWACGDNGALLHSTDAGLSWQKVETNSNATLRAVLFTDKDHGFLAGDGDPNSPEAKKGHIVFGHGEPMTYSSLLSTTDAGKTWKKRDLFTNFQITSIATPDGKTLLLGNSGGEKHMDGDFILLKGEQQKWTARRAFHALFAVAALDDKHLVAVGSPVSVGFTPEPTDDLYTHKRLRAVYSEDAGDSWKLSEGSDGPVPLRALAANKDASVLIALGDRGHILRSEDKGASWQKIESNTDKPLKAAAWINNTCLIVGRNGTILLSTDNAKTFTPIPIDPTTHLLSVAPTADTFLAVTTEGNILRAKEKALVDSIHK